MCNIGHHKDFILLLPLRNLTDDSINIFTSMASKAGRKWSGELYLTPEKTTSSPWKHFVGQIKSYCHKKKKISKTLSEIGEKYNPIIYLEEELEYFWMVLLITTG